MTKKKVEWISRWGTQLASAPTLPGVWARRDGGWQVRARVVGHDGKTREVFRALTEPSDLTAAQALGWLEAEKTKLRLPPASGPSTSTQFSVYAARLFDRKKAEGSIRSAAGRRKWLDVLAKHLIPAFPDVDLTTLRRAQLLAWRDTVALRIAAGKLSPRTANTWIAILKTIVSAFVDEHELERNPAHKLPAFPTIDHPTHTDESPNALAPTDVPLFLVKLKTKYPQHYAMTVLGLSLGLRPSSLRPLRRSGPEADIDWTTGELLVRRSQTYGDEDEVMDSTKQGTRERKALPPALVEVLRWHVDHQITTDAQQESVLLFPSESGGFRSRAVLDKPFDKIATLIGLRYAISAKAMRRTYQDLAREAGVPDLVTRSISGHATEEMQQHYSTVGREEQRQHLAKVIDLAGVREAKKTGTDGGE